MISIAPSFPHALLGFAALFAESEVRITHAPGAPEFSATLTLPERRGPHPVALLVSPAGEHPRDEIVSGSRHWAALAQSLAERGIASLRVDNRGVGGSRNVAWPAWSYDLALEDSEKDVAGHLDWLRARPEIDRNRVGLVAHGDGTVAATIAASKDAGIAFVVLSSRRGTDSRCAAGRERRATIARHVGSTRRSARPFGRSLRARPVENSNKKCKTS